MRDEEITRVVAEKVMGGLLSYDPLGVFVNGDGVIFEPLTDDADACDVLDKMKDDGWRITLDSQLEAEWSASFYGEAGDYNAANPSRNRAICEAALRAVGAWREEEEP